MLYRCYKNLGVERILGLKPNMLYVLKYFFSLKVGIGGEVLVVIVRPEVSLSIGYDLFGHVEGTICGLQVKCAHLRRMLEEFVFLLVHTFIFL